MSEWQISCETEIKQLNSILKYCLPMLIWKWILEIFLSAWKSRVLLERLVLLMKRTNRKILSRCFHSFFITVQQILICCQKNHFSNRFKTTSHNPNILKVYYDSPFIKLGFKQTSCCISWTETFYFSLSYQVRSYHSQGIKSYVWFKLWVSIEFIQ